MPSPRQRAQRLLPTRVVDALDQGVFRARKWRVERTHGVYGRVNVNPARRDDYYSVLPVLDELRAHRTRWDRPSALAGIEVDVESLADRLDALAERWEDDYRARAGSWADNASAGFGPGYPAFDARTLYYMMREHRPKRYLEVGSGLSTHYAAIGGRANADDGADPLQLTCVEPYPYDKLRTLPGVELIVDEVQNVPVSTFAALEAGDILFIDSSHALKIDSDVAYLMLEVLPAVQPGVLIHIHDVHFPYNTPYPTGTWIFGERWPVFWQEAMAVQMFLAFNRDFEILLSTPLVRHHDEKRLTSRFADYTPVADDPNPPSSLWLRRRD